MLTNYKTKKEIITNKEISLIKDLALVLLFAFLTALSSELKLEIGVVPITMQTLFVLLSGAILGKKKGALSQALYLLAGIVGVPWFARGGGLSYFLSPTFGYLLGFIPASYLVGLITEKKTFLNSLIGLTAGTFSVYIFGVWGLLRFMNLNQALTVGIYPFIIGDIIKIFLSIIILKLNNNE